MIDWKEILNNIPFISLFGSLYSPSSLKKKISKLSKIREKILLINEDLAQILLMPLIISKSLWVPFISINKNFNG